MCAWIRNDGIIFGLEELKKAVEVFNKAGKLLGKWIKIGISCQI